ncbi:hypothetical protein GPB2148_3511 [marine gamma proteobacterium HTCC2148]|nr:hypothetical protein GPB2148_3511 [marine gamma proteobacterium HTCC2148]
MGVNVICHCDIATRAAIATGFRLEVSISVATLPAVATDSTNGYCRLSIASRSY